MESVNHSGTRRVLAVDDDPIMRELMAQKFAEIGYGVLVAEDGESATALVETEGLELAVVDINMPLVDGFELLKRIRRNPRAANLPVIVATAMGDDASIERAYQLGASSFVTKPINWAQFAHHAQFVIRNGQIERDLRLAQAEAAAAAQMKNGLFRVLGHELKTPLTALVGLTDVLAKSLGARLQSLDAEHLTHVTDAAQRLNQVVSDILILARATAGRDRMVHGAMSARELIDDGLLGFKLRAASLGITLDVQAPDNGLMVLCDTHLARQAIRRLIDNALKFTPAGGTVVLDAGQTGDGFVEISVRDTGPGLSAERLRDCLKPFVQGDMGYARPAEGLGLGLPIAKAIAEAHGGSLAIDSTPGEGLTARLLLPEHAGSRLAQA